MDRAVVTRWTRESKEPRRCVTKGGHHTHFARENEQGATL